MVCAYSVLRKLEEFIFMIDKYVNNTLIYGEFDNKDNVYWFDFKRQKFLHNIDTYYYSVNIECDESNFKKFINVLKADKEAALKSDFKKSSLGSQYLCNGYTFGQYKYDVELPDEYLFLIAENVKNKETPNIIVQLRSYFLWLHGIVKALEYSFSDLEKILSEYGINVSCVKSNRIDFCWHTNYVQDVEVFFNPKNIAQMRVSRLHEFDMHGRFVGDEGVDFDYLRMGRLTSNNILFRAYLKSKEVVEMGYKPWFLKVWLFHGLISRYDFYVYEECSKRGSWQYLHKARLKFYYDYGQDVVIKNRIAGYLNQQNGTKINNYDDLVEFADMLTPKVNMILNFEYQTKRKFFRSINFKNFRGREGVLADVMTELDFRPLVIDYLTNDTLRFVEKFDESKDINKSRRDYAPFWKRLRNTRLVDVIIPPEDIKLVREYTSTLNKELVKLNAARAISTFNVYEDRTGTSVYEDILQFVSSLNDNDMYKLKMYKYKKMHLLNNKIDTDASVYNRPVYGIVDLETGEIFT